MPSIKATSAPSFSQEDPGFALSRGGAFPAFGREIDGDVTLSGTKDINTTRSGSNAVHTRAVDAPVGSVTAISGATLTLASILAPGTISDFKPGDCCLLINLQGTVASHANVGNFEYGTIESVGVSDVTLKNAPTKLYGDTDNSSIGFQKVILMRVPEYKDLTVPVGATLTCSAWNGTLGGVLAFFAKSINCTGGGKLSIEGKGYRGATVDGGTGEGEQGGWNTVQTANIGCGAGGSTTLVSGTGGAAVGTADLTKVFMGGGGGAGVSGESGSTGLPGGTGVSGSIGGTGSTGGPGGSSGAGGGGGGGGGGGVGGFVQDTPTQNPGGFGGGPGGASVPFTTQTGGAGGAISPTPGTVIRSGHVQPGGGPGGNGGSAIPGAPITGGAGGAGGGGGTGGAGSSGGTGGAGGSRGSSGNGGGILLASIKTAVAFTSSNLGVAGGAGGAGTAGVAALDGSAGADGSIGSTGTAGAASPGVRNAGASGTTQPAVTCGWGGAPLNGTARPSLAGGPGGGGGGGSSGTAGGGGAGGQGGRGGQGGKGGKGGNGGSGGQGSSGGSGAAGQAILHFYSISSPTAISLNAVATAQSPAPTNGAAGGPVSNTPVPRPPYIPAPQPAPVNGDGWPGAVGSAGANGAAGAAGFVGGGGGGGSGAAEFNVRPNNPGGGNNFNAFPATWPAGGGGGGATSSAGGGGSAGGWPPAVIQPGNFVPTGYVKGANGTTGGNGGAGVAVTIFFQPSPHPTPGSNHTYVAAGAGAISSVTGGGGNTGNPFNPGHNPHAPGGGGGAGGAAGSAGAGGTGGGGGTAGGGGLAGTNGSPGAGGVGGLRGAGGGSRNSGGGTSAGSEGRIRVTYFVKDGVYASQTPDGDGLFTDTTVPGWKESL